VLVRRVKSGRTRDGSICAQLQPGRLRKQLCAGEREDSGNVGRLGGVSLPRDEGLQAARFGINVVGGGGGARPRGLGDVAVAAADRASGDV
jgi:hypothetical protein